MKAIFLLIIWTLICSPDVFAGSAQNWQPTATTGELVVAVEGFSGPEAVRYDPQQDLYFVSNFNGDTSGDANGFVSKVSAEGEILQLKFM